MPTGNVCFQLIRFRLIGKRFFGETQEAYRYSIS